MNYELAKKLKDAGFPQKEFLIQSELGKKPMYDVGYHLTADDLTTDNEGKLVNKARWTSVFNPEWLATDEGKNATVYVPTLSELIEACGNPKGFNVAFNEINSKWYARKDYEYDIPRTEDELLKGVQSGASDSPVEAVANLWLELNKKHA